MKLMPGTLVLGIKSAIMVTDSHPIMLSILYTYRVRAITNEAITDTVLTTVEITESL